ncbi:MAG: helix-turn-helix transcriptional regulator [Chitinophagaceae bacterium]
MGGIANLISDNSTFLEYLHKHTNCLGILSKKYLFFSTLLSMSKTRKTKFELEVVAIIKSLRDAHGLTQDDIAAVLNVSRGYIGQIESPNYPSTYSLNDINLLSLEFECAPGDLLPKSAIEDRKIEGR